MTDTKSGVISRREQLRALVQIVRYRIVVFTVGVIEDDIFADELEAVRLSFISPIIDNGIARILRLFTDRRHRTDQNIDQSLTESDTRFFISEILSHAGRVFSSQQDYPRIDLRARSRIQTHAN